MCVDAHTNHNATDSLATTHTGSRLITKGACLSAARSAPLHQPPSKVIGPNVDSHKLPLGILNHSCFLSWQISFTARVKYSNPISS